MDDIINGTRVREMAAQVNMSYGRIAKDQHVDPKLIRKFMETNEIKFTCQSKCSKAANNMKTPVSDTLDLAEVRKLAKEPGSTLKSMAAKLRVGYETIRLFTVLNRVSVSKRKPASKSQARFLTLNDIREKAAVEGASLKNIAKVSNVSPQTIRRFMKKHDITLTSACTRSVNMTKYMARLVNTSKNSDTSDRVSIASLINS